MEEDKEYYYLVNENEININKIGKYKVEKILGKGAFGIVYLCEFEGNFYAIKKVLDTKRKKHVEAISKEIDIMK